MQEDSYRRNGKHDKILLSSEEDPFTFTDLLCEIAETLDLVVVPQPRPSLELMDDGLE